MGKKSKQKTTNEPSTYAKGYITPAANALSGAYTQSQPAIESISSLLQGAVPGVAEKALGTDPTLAAGQGYATDVLSGKYLNGNPYTQSIIDKTAGDVTNGVQSAFGSAGRTGSGGDQYALSKGLADSENTLRYNDYNNAMQNMTSVLGQVPGLESAQYAGIAPLLALAQGSVGLPLDAANEYAGGIGSLLGQYNTQTTTQKQGLGNTLGGLLGSGLAGWASGGFKGA